MLIDLHVHAGNNGLAPSDVLARAPALGLEGVAFVGDDAFTDVRALRAKGGPVRVFSGAEVTTDRGHYLVFLPGPDAPPPLDALFGERGPTGWPIRDVLARTRALGGAVIAAHPYDTTIPAPGGDILFTLPTLSAVETVNGRRNHGLAHQAIEAAETLGLPCVGGSDARGSLDEVGKAATLFTRTIENEAELCAALRSGACWPVEFGLPPAHLMRRQQSGPPRERERESASSERGGGAGGEAQRRRRRR